MDNASAIVLAILLAAVAALVPRVGVLALWRAARSRRRREAIEDALKHVLAWEQRGKSATQESLAGALNMRPQDVFELSTNMQKRGLLQSEPDGFSLTTKGEQLALQVVRAHRLWERYLADDAGLPMDRLHQAAEKAEHELTSEALDELEAHLGHPQSDPHGDPIPTKDGHLAPLNAVALTKWPAGEPARIVHLEDEPAVVFQQILAAGLRPGMTLRVLHRDAERLVVSDGSEEHRFAPAVAANVHVADADAFATELEGAIPLSALEDGRAATVVQIDDACRGFSRRRLMDLGLTPGAEIQVALQNTFGDPRAFRIRGTTIALRKAQAQLVWVRPSEEEAVA